MKISVITPTYNRKEFLLESIKSLQVSALVPFVDVDWEHIICDDGSTDGTAEIFKSLSDPRVKYIRNSENKGAAKARNDAVMQSAGDYLFFLDSDDIILSRTLYNFADKAKAYPDKAWFVADFLTSDESLRYLIGQDYYSWDFNSIEDMLSSIFRGEHFIQHSFMVRKDIFMEVGMYDPDQPRAQDVDLCIRLLLKGHVPVNCDFTSHLHRFHDSNMSVGITEEKHKAFMKEMEEGKYAGWRNSLVIK